MLSWTRPQCSENETLNKRTFCFSLTASSFERNLFAFLERSGGTQEKKHRCVLERCSKERKAVRDVQVLQDQRCFPTNSTCFYDVAQSCRRPCFHSGCPIQTTLPTRLYSSCSTFLACHFPLLPLHLANRFFHCTFFVLVQNLLLSMLLLPCAFQVCCLHTCFPNNTMQRNYGL